MLWKRNLYDSVHIDRILVLFCENILWNRLLSLWSNICGTLVMAPAIGCDTNSWERKIHIGLTSLDWWWVALVLGSWEVWFNSLKR